MDILITIPDDIYPKVVTAARSLLPRQQGETDKELIRRSALLYLETITKDNQVSSAVQAAIDQSILAQATISVVENDATNQANATIDFAPKPDTIPMSD
jgi:Arc/MetJ family transcription regulator